MTLLCMSVTSNRADFITDSMAYSRNGRRIEWLDAGKITVLEAARTAVACQGDGLLAATYARNLDVPLADLDDVIAHSLAILPTLWDQLADFYGTDPADRYSTVLIAGYSRQQRRMVGRWLTSADRFATAHETASAIHPAPTGSRQPLLDVEGTPLLARLDRTPQGHRGWAQLARQVHRDRSFVDDHTRILMGGDVHRVTLTPTGAKRSVLLTLPTEGPEFERMLERTLHPTAQAGECYCGSGDPRLHCHAPTDDQPCPCGSGDAFGVCCHIRAAAPGDPDVAMALEHAPVG